MRTLCVIGLVACGSSAAAPVIDAVPVIDASPCVALDIDPSCGGELDLTGAWTLNGVHEDLSSRTQDTISFGIQFAAADGTCLTATSDPLPNVNATPYWPNPVGLWDTGGGTAEHSVRSYNHHDTWTICASASIAITGISQLNMKDVEGSFDEMEQVTGTLVR